MAKTKVKKSSSKPKAKRKTKSAEYSTVPLSRLFDKNLDLDNRAAERPTNPFAQSEWVFICVDMIVKTARSIQMMLSTASDDIVESGEAYDLLFNSKLTFSQFITETAGYLALYRECYWVFLDTAFGGIRPKQILVAGPQQVRPVIEHGVLVGYELHAEGAPAPIPLLLSDVWPLIDFNPASKFHGIGPTAAGKLAISTAYQAALLNEATLANGGKLSGVISMPQGVKLDDDEKRFYLSQFEAKHKGARNAGRWALITGGVEVKPFSQTMVELQMIDLRKFDCAAICALFGVPIELVSLNSEAQYAHGPAQQRFLLNTMSPLLSFIAENITLGVLRLFRYQKAAAVKTAQAKTFLARCKSLPAYRSYRDAKVKAISNQNNLFAWFAIEDHPTIQEMLREKTEKVIKYTDAGIPLNQIIDAYDLPFEHVDWGDDHFVSAGLIPAKWIIDAGPDMLTGPSLPEPPDDEPNKDEEKKTAEKIEKASDALKLRLWNNWVVSWAGIEREYTTAIRTYFIMQQRVIISKLKKELAKKSVEKSDDIVARIVFDITRDNGKLRAINQVFFNKASELGARQALTEVGGLKDQPLKEALDAVKRSSAMRRALVISNSNIQGINQVTQRKLAASLLDGLKKEEALNDLVKRVQDQLGNNRSRALSIARTQTAGAVGSGRHAGFGHTGVELKGWVTSHDEQVRKAHKNAEKEYAKGIGVNEYFWVGGEKLLHPGDPHGTPGNIINCRCVEIAIKVAGKMFSLEYWSNYKFYSYEDMLAAA